MMHVRYKLTALRLTSADRKYPPYVLAETLTKNVKVSAKI